VKITLKTDKFIRGGLTKSGTTVDISDEVAEILIEEGAAIKATAKAKKTNKAEA